MGLVDDDRVIAAEHSVALKFGQEDAVGHHTDQRAFTDVVGEPNAVAHLVTEIGAELLGDASGDRASGYAARLCVPDEPVDAAAGLEAELRELRALPRAGLARDDDHLVVADRRDDLVAVLADGQRRGIADAALGDDGVSHGPPNVGGRRRPARVAARMRAAPTCHRSSMAACLANRAPLHSTAI